MSELFAPKDLLEACVGVQQLINEAPAEEQDKLGLDFEQMMLHSLYYGAHRVEIHSQLAYGLPDGLTTESLLWPSMAYGRLRVRALLAGVRYWRVNNRPTVTWMAGEPQIRQLWDDAEAAIDIDPALQSQVTVVDRVATGSVLRRPLYFPVDQIESALVAA